MSDISKSAIVDLSKVHQEETSDPVRITIDVSPETRKAFKRACLDLGTTMSALLRKAIDRAIWVALDMVTEAEMEAYAKSQEPPDA